MLDCPSPSTKQPIIYFIVAEVETVKIGQDVALKHVHKVHNSVVADISIL